MNENSKQSVNKDSPTALDATSAELAASEKPAPYVLIDEDITFALCPQLTTMHNIAMASKYLFIAEGYSRVNINTPTRTAIMPGMTCIVIKHPTTPVATLNTAITIAPVFVGGFVRYVITRESATGIAKTKAATRM